MILNNIYDFSANEDSYQEVIRERTLDDLLDEIHLFFKRENINDFEEKEELLKEIKGAFFLAQRAHSGQDRDSGEEYIQHPLRIAIKMVKEYGNKIPTNLFFETIKLALLHDVKEDGGINDETIDDNFGKIVEKGVSLLTKEPWQNFVDNDYIISNPLDAKREGKSARDKKYFGKLNLLKERNYDELKMLDFSLEQKENIRKMVLAIKGFDRLDNHKTHGKQSKHQIGKKVLETNTELVPLLSEDHPTIVDKLKEQIRHLVKKRLDGNQTYLI